MWQPFGSKMYSIGSSSVMMCSRRSMIHLLDQGGERGRLAAADRTGDEDQPVLVTRQQLQVLGQTEFIHRPHLAC